MNWKAQTLPVLLTGLPCRSRLKEREGKWEGNKTKWASLPQPAQDRIVRCSPFTQVTRGNYKTPTFLIHGQNDELIPWQQSDKIWREMKSRGIAAELILVEGAPHVCDTSSNPESTGWKAVLQGYRFLAERVECHRGLSSRKLSDRVAS